MEPERPWPYRCLKLFHMQGTSEVQRSPVVEQLAELQAPLIIQMAARGLNCFDCEFYKQHYEDIAPMSCWDAFIHFINQGQFEMRVHRYDLQQAWMNRPHEARSPYACPVELAQFQVFTIASTCASRSVDA